jgi:hypothetical protein
MALLLTTFQLSLAEHVHEFDACQGALSCLTELDPEIGRVMRLTA